MDLFQNRLRTALLSYTQAELAYRVGVSPQHVCDVVKGRRVPLPVNGERGVSPRLLAFLGLERVLVLKELRSPRKGRT